MVANGWQELAKHFALLEHFTIPDQVFEARYGLTACLLKIRKLFWKPAISSSDA